MLVVHVYLIEVVCVCVCVSKPNVFSLVYFRSRTKEKQEIFGLGCSGLAFLGLENPSTTSALDRIVVRMFGMTKVHFESAFLVFVSRLLAWIFFM